MTDGVLAACEAGIVTACSVVPSGPDFDRAARLLRARPGVEVGLHFTLVGAPLVSALDDVPSLAPGGRPLGDHRAFLGRLGLGRIDLRDVERELRRQLQRARDAGLRVSHLNGHQHLHVAPGVVDVVARVAREAGIGYVRIPDEPVGLRRPRGAAVWALGIVARRARRILIAAGIATNDRAIGLAHAGHLTPQRLRALLVLAEGVTELVAHPGTGNAAIGRDFRWGYDWDGEREALSDPGMRDEITRRGLRLAGPSEVAVSPR
jgi:predicted glycoside hydrolase/deacetylase ChbG (UPF0249 family)